jgi:serine/threonine protein kinase
MSANLIGQTLLNQFRVDAFVAAGGMGAVYRVWDLKRNVPLAMKVLHNDLADDPSVFKRFQREANALKKLAHPNIVPFYGLYQARDFTFLLECFVDGPTLGDILRQRQGSSLPVGDALAYLKALSAALGYAHANGVVHCDVKPGNVMLDRDGTIYLTDFGIARHTESTTVSMAGTGTPAYMAPEQILRGAVSPATDVYALGVVLFEMLTGQRPFRGTEMGTEKGGASTNERICYGHLNLAPPDPRSLTPEIPSRLSEVVLKALNKRPEARYVSTQALFIAARAGSEATSVSVANDTVIQRLPLQHGHASKQGNLHVPATPHRRASQWPAWGIAGLLLITGVILAVLGVEVYTSIKGAAAVPPSPRIPPATSVPAINLAPLPTFLAPSETDHVRTTAKTFDALARETYPEIDYLKVPAYFSYTITTNTSAILLWVGGFCAKDQATLDENQSKMGLQFRMNGQDVSLNHFLRTDSTQNGQKCVAYMLGVKGWEASLYKAVTTLTFKVPLNDGTSDFPAGQQVYEYNISVRP